MQEYFDDLKQAIGADEPADPDRGAAAREGAAPTSGSWNSAHGSATRTSHATGRIATRTAAGGLAKKLPNSAISRSLSALRLSSRCRVARSDRRFELQRRRAALTGPRHGLPRLSPIRVR
jgi:hypothetical protein